MSKHFKNELTKAFFDLHGVVTRQYHQGVIVYENNVDFGIIKQACDKMIDAIVYDDEARAERKDNISLQENDWRSKEESMLRAVQGYAEKPFLDLTTKERLALMNLTIDPTAYKDDKIISLQMDSIWEFNSKTNEGPDKDEAQMFSLEMWDSYNLVIVYYPKRFDNLEFNGLASNIYQALMDQEWYGGYNATYEEIEDLHPELLGSWSK